MEEEHKEGQPIEDGPKEGEPLYSLAISNTFKNDFKRCEKRGLEIELLRIAMKLLQTTGSLPFEYNPHKLSGNYDGKWEAHIKGRNSDWLMIWDQNDTELTLLMLRTGTHSDLY